MAKISIFGVLTNVQMLIHTMFRGSKVGVDDLGNTYYRRRGIGARLVTYCEDLARSEGKTDMGISVGLHTSFGSAQRLYVRMGYLPDGAGVAYDDEIVRMGDMRVIDDNLTLKLTKNLTPP